MALAKVAACAIVGLEGHLVEVQVDIARQGLPNFLIVGLPDAAVQEARERVRAAVRNSGYPSLNGRRYRCCGSHPGGRGRPDSSRGCGPA